MTVNRNLNATEADAPLASALAGSSMRMPKSPFMNTRLAAPLLPSMTSRSVHERESSRHAHVARDRPLASLLASSAQQPGGASSGVGAEGVQAASAVSDLWRAVVREDTGLAVSSAEVRAIVHAGLQLCEHSEAIARRSDALDEAVRAHEREVGVERERWRTSEEVWALASSCSCSSPCSHPHLFSNPTPNQAIGRLRERVVELGTSVAQHEGAWPQHMAEMEALAPFHL